jgi:hypothetical protein
MLTALTRGPLFRVAIWIAALAVFAFVAPPIAVALSPTQHAVYCLTHDDHAIGDSAEDQAVDHHKTGDLDHAKHEGTDQKARCCGLFGVTALPPGFGHVFAYGWTHTPVFFGLQASFSGRTPDRIDRPPISRLSF